jgi:hypothetical protein
MLYFMPASLSLMSVSDACLASKLGFITKNNECITVLHYSDYNWSISVFIHVFIYFNYVGIDNSIIKVTFFEKLPVQTTKFIYNCCLGIRQPVKVFGPTSAYDCKSSANKTECHIVQTSFIKRHLRITKCFTVLK